MERHDHDPSSSLGDRPSLLERAKDKFKVWGAGVALGATVVMGLAGCGRGDRIAVPEQSPSSSASLDPSESPSASPSPSETVDPEVAARMRAREEYDEQVKKIDKTFNEILNKQIRSLINRGEIEKNFWKEEENRINSLSHKEAIEELIRVKKLNNKIKQIDKYIGDLKKYV